MKNLLKFIPSGNIVIVLLLSGLFLFSSCDPLKKTQKPNDDEEELLDEIKGKRVYNSETGKWEYAVDVEGKMDTVQWSEVDTKENPPIGSDSSYYKNNEGDNPNNPNGSGFFETYNVSIMMPFLTDQVNNMESGIHQGSLTALSFYEGAKMALDQLSSEGVSLKVSVMDTKRSDAETDFLLERTDVNDAHLIIGPYGGKPLSRVAEFAKERMKPMVSPINTSNSVTTDNPYYIQSNPSLQTHCEAITKHALKTYSPDQVVLVVRNKSAEVERLKYFQDANKEIAGSSFAPRLKEYVVDATKAEEFGELDIEPYFQDNRPTVFIIPSYSNETFIISFLRQLALAKGKREVVVYGMPRWMEFERVSYDYYEQLNVHITEANFINLEDENVKIFRKNFYEKYGALPDEKAFAGYDMTLYFGRQLNKHGMNLVQNIDSEFEQHLSTRFEFQKNISPSDVAEENFTKVNFLENKYVNVLKFKDYYFQLAD